MYLTRSEYDRGVNTFSPEGRLFQVSNDEYLDGCVKHVFNMANAIFSFCLSSLRLSMPLKLLNWDLQL